MINVAAGDTDDLVDLWQTPLCSCLFSAVQCSAV